MSIQTSLKQGAARTPARHSLLAAAVAGTLCSAALAQDATHDEMVVTATRTEMSSRDVLADITVIDRAQIEAMAPSRSIGEVLQRLAGVQFHSNGGRGTTQGISIRGAGNGYTLVLIDGVRYGSLTLGSPALENFPIELIERIEVLKGPASALYGSDAVGGVIQIFTKRGKNAHQPLIANASVTAGEYGHKSGSAGFHGAQHNWDYSLSLSRVIDHSFSATNPKVGSYSNPDRDGFTQTALTASLGFEFNEKWRLDSTLINSKGRVFYDDDPTPDPYINMKTEALKLQLSGEITPLLSTKFSLSRSKDIQNYLNAGNSSSAHRTQQQEIKWESEIKTFAGNALLGLERLEQKIDPNDSYGIYSIKNRDINSIFVGLTGQENKNFWQINLRRDKNSQFGNFTTYGLSYGYELTKNLRLHIAHGKSTKAPTFNQLYYNYFDPSWGVGNPNLQPEHGKSNEIGGTWLFNNYEAKLTYFSNRIFNKISSINNKQENTPGKTILKGWSLNQKWSRNNWTISSTYDYLKSKTPNGTPLDRQAKNQFSINIDKEIGQWRMGGNALYVGTRKNYGNELASYTTLDLHAEYKLRKDWSVQARIANFTDKQYETAYGYNQLGRAAYLTLKWVPK